MSHVYQGPDRRRYVRIPEKDLLSHDPLVIKSFDMAGVHKNYASTRDLGEGGLLFQAHLLFPIGVYIKLQFYVHDWEKHKVAFYKENDLDKEPFTVIGKVVRTELLASGHYDIGIEFVAVDTGHKQALKNYIRKIKPDA